MSRARHAVKRFTPDFCCEAHIIAYSGLFGKEIHQKIYVYGDYADNEQAKKMLKKKMDNKIKRDYGAGFRSYVSCKFHKHIKGMFGFCFGDKEGIDYEEI